MILQLSDQECPVLLTIEIELIKSNTLIPSVTALSGTVSNQTILYRIILFFCFTILPFLFRNEIFNIKFKSFQLSHLIFLV